MRHYKAVFPVFGILLISALVNAWADAPINLPIDSRVEVVVGKGTSLEPDTAFEGFITHYDDDGLGFISVEGKRYYIKWDHIRGVNGVRISDQGWLSDIPTDLRDSLRPNDVHPIRHVRFFGNVDLFIPNRIGSTSNSSQFPAVNVHETLTPGDAAVRGGKMYTQVGGGGKIGILRPIENYLDIGMSVGYAYGPTTSINGKAWNANGDGGSFTFERQLQYLRIIMETAGHISFNQDWGFNVGGGVGVGQGYVREKCSPSGYLTCENTRPAVISPSTPAPSRSSVNSANWTGLTWEVSPSFSYHLDGNHDITFGVRYSAFPTFKGNSVISPIQSSGWGTFLGFIF